MKTAWYIEWHVHGRLFKGSSDHKIFWTTQIEEAQTYPTQELAEQTIQAIRRTWNHGALKAVELVKPYTKQLKRHQQPADSTWYCHRDGGIRDLFSNRVNRPTNKKK